MFGDIPYAKVLITVTKSNFPGGWYNPKRKYVYRLITFSAGTRGGIIYPFALQIHLQYFTCTTVAKYLRLP